MKWQDLYHQLHGDSSELRELDDDLFAKLIALTRPGNRARPKMQDLFSPSPVYRGDQEQWTWLVNLLNYNIEMRKLRESSAVQETSDDAYVAASIIQNVFQERFESFAQLRAYLTKRPGIRTRKPKSQRLEIHAGDLIKQLDADDATNFENADRYQHEIERRKNEARTGKSSSSRDAK